ncbi:hypothetical protein PUNSTDRAFT_42961 [Punctularia strigosozonata HHB-11173 SS5]|uniref:uncharacterized protein n=1 Tax=Punctularia strigosozonata (strain HHB-11173) TaxID=741275 RepID=UPI0004416EEB|nr:uncharacterized protein PUNSTDRAFT_42961 [Punctularia strigosozonata HHB-11173 SS5]EIN11820.1 hypothetical protein PUNSTDRAFT_42961 [Punctularia strigosozonata HHB-11173 SS5]
MTKFTFITIAAIAAQVTLGAVLEQRTCGSPDTAAPVCQTSSGSPLVQDCQVAIQQLGSSSCKVSNTGGSDCSTQVTVGTCKIDACSDGNTPELQPGVNCGGYLQSILNSCQSNGMVGGILSPESCNVAGEGAYRLQFSKA